MLAQKASEWDLQLSFLDKSQDYPAGQISSRFSVGDFKSYHDVLAFGLENDIISIEIENVNTEALLELEARGKTVIPSAHSIATIKDKGLQKLFYIKHDLPTSPFELYKDKAEIIHAVQKNALTLPFVQKSREAGYDGKGVQIVNNKTDLDQLMDTPSMVEKAISIDKEVAMIVARNASGHIRHFEPVEMVFDPEANLLDYLLCPAQIPEKTLARLKEIADRLLEALNFTGLLAIEYFIDTEGEVLINEVAPRTHNSGHHTINACTCSQFEMQLRCLLDLELPDTGLRDSFAGIVNLVGEGQCTPGPVFYEGFDELLSMENVFPHVYGKKTVKPFRKMGHVTVLAESKARIAEKINQIKNIIRVTSWKKNQ